MAVATLLVVLEEELGAITKAWALAAQGHGLLWLYGPPPAGANTVAAIVLPTPTAFLVLLAATLAAAPALLFLLFTVAAPTVAWLVDWRTCLA